MDARAKDYVADSIVPRIGQELGLDKRTRPPGPDGSGSIAYTVRTTLASRSPRPGQDPSMVPLRYLKEDAATGCRIGGACPVGFEWVFTDTAAQYFGTFPLLALENVEFSLFHRFDRFGHDPERDLIDFNNEVLRPSR